MGKLTIQEVSKILTEKNGLSQQEANVFATELFAIILQQLQQGETVKVKGLGTFRIINVEARESVSVRTGERVVIESHSKVTFTPDTVMKELVNKPFSQFETVVLNDGVEFSDMKDEAADDVNDAADEESEAPVTILTEQPAEPELPEEPEQPQESVTPAEPTAPQEPEPAAVPLVEIAEEKVPAEETAEEEPAVEEEQEKEYKKHSLFERVALIGLLYGLCTLALILLAAYGGYKYGCLQSHQPAAPDTIVVRDTVYMPQEAEVTIAEEIIQEAPTVKEKPKPEVKEEVVDKWSAKDERVRLGAYRIVGTKEEVTVQAGQTFYSICKAHLGPDMQCYVEVYNDLPKNPTIKTGQVIKIPKLEWKKKRSRN